jgi:hypothetical protein
MLKPILIGISLTTLFSCTKNGQPMAPKQVVNNCKIVAAYTVFDGDTTGNFTYTYNTEGKLSGSTFNGSTPYTATYSYSGNTIYRSISAGINSSVDTITLNNAGLILADKEVNGLGVHLITCTYDAGNELQTYSDQQDTFPPVVTTYSFMLGDAVTINNGISLKSITYDIDRPAVSGNLEQFTQLLNLGAMYSKSQHLPTLIQATGNPDLSFSYVYTSNGNIASLTESDGINITTISYAYDCQ